MSGHAFSRDGVNWTWSAAQPFHGKVCEKPHEPGSPFTSVCGSRERPFLVRSSAMSCASSMSTHSSTGLPGNLPAAQAEVALVAGLR